MEMTKRFNSGGAGNAKSEYFSEDLKEITEENKDVALLRTQNQFGFGKELTYNFVL